MEAAAFASIVKQSRGIVERVSCRGQCPQRIARLAAPEECAGDSARNSHNQISAQSFFGLPSGMKSFWLVKQEPSSYSWSDFVPERETSWTGVRNFAARNNLRKMQTGDEVLFYHSGDEKAVVGIAKVVRTAYPDSTAKEGEWSTVDLAAVKPLARPVTLREIKGNSRLKGIALVRQSRLSVMPLREADFREIVKIGTG
jgi:predicted RNA-binding protein with PUA-like domain